MSAYRFSSTIQGLGKPFKGSSGGPPHRKSQEKGSSRNSLVGRHSKKASLGKEGQQVLMDSRPFPCLQRTQFRGHLPLHKQTLSDLQKASSLLIVQASHQGPAAAEEQAIILQQGCRCLPVCPPSTTAPGHSNLQGLAARPLVQGRASSHHP